MSGRSIELSDAGDRVVIRFPYDTGVVARVRELPQRRFEQAAKCWSCPIERIVDVVDALRPHGFAVAAAARSLYVERGGAQALPAEPDDPAATDAAGDRCRGPG